MFKYIILLLTILNIVVSQPRLVGGFTSQCKNFSVSGFRLYARCLSDSGNYVSRSINFSGCLFNYYGYLTTQYENMRELTTRRCYVSGDNLYCTCQQPGGRWNSCSISLNNVFYWDGYSINC